MEVLISLGNSHTLRWKKALWSSQSKLNLAVTTTHLTLVWVAQHFGAQTYTLIAPTPLVHSGNIMHGRYHTGPQDRKGF